MAKRKKKDPELQSDGTYGYAPLTSPSDGPEPLPEVEVKPLPPQPYYYPFKSAKDYVEALHEENDRLMAEINNKQLRSGTVPIWVSRPVARPRQRSMIQASTRRFSPKPGHRKRPEASRRNQFTW